MEEKIVEEIERMKYVFLNILDISLIKNEIEHYISNINVVDNEGYNLLYWCWRLYNNKELLLFLINRGIDINHYDFQGETLLIHTCRSGDFDTTKLLLENGANVNHSDYNSDTALLWASYSNYLEIVKLLVFHKADVEHLYCDGRNSIMWASKRGNLEVVKYLSEFTSEIMREDKYGDTIYTLADNIEIKSFILEFLNINRLYMCSWVENNYYKHQLFDTNIIKKVFELYH